MKIAKFTYGNGQYWPANKEAIAACAILSKMVLSADDMLAVKSKGYDARLQNGEPIGKLDVRV